jgi:hypothetical protein
VEFGTRGGIERMMGNLRQWSEVHAFENRRGSIRDESRRSR